MFTNGSYRLFFIKEGDDYLPIGCLTENSFDEEVEMINTTTRDNNGWKSSRPTNQRYNISFSGLQINTYFSGADTTKISYDKLKVIKRNRTQIEWAIANSDLVFVDYGKGYITNLSESNVIDEMITFSGGVEGFGMPILASDLESELQHELQHEI